MNPLTLLAFVRHYWRALGVIAVILTAIAGVVWLVLAIRADGAADQRAATEAERHQVELKAAAGREVAATERHRDQAAVADRLEEWNRDAAILPDAPPEPRAVPRRCRQLRENPAVDVDALAACRGPEAQP